MSFLYQAATSSSRVSVATIRRSGTEPVDSFNAYGSVESIARTNDGFVAITRAQRSPSVDIVRATGADTETLVSSNAEKRAIVASSDGNYIAWAESTGTPDGVPYTAATETWTVQLRLPDGTIRSLGTGYAPQFLDTETLLFTAPESLMVAVLPDGEAKPEPYPGAQSIAFTAKAAQGTLLVPFPDESTYLAYRIVHTRPLTTESLGELPESFHDVAIGQDALYGLRTEERRQEVVRLSLGALQEPVSVFAFPAAFTVTSLIP